MLIYIHNDEAKLISTYDLVGSRHHGVATKSNATGIQIFADMIG